MTDKIHIKDYLETNKIMQKDFAEILGIHPNYLWMLCNDKFIPSERLAQKIERLTKGQVTSEKLRRKHEKARCPTCGHKITGRQ